MKNPKQDEQISKEKKLREFNPTEKTHLEVDPSRYSEDAGKEHWVRQGNKGNQKIPLVQPNPKTGE